MDSITLHRSFYFDDGVESSASDSTLLGITDFLEKKTSLERPAVPVSGESRYLSQLWVFRNRDPWEELYPAIEWSPEPGAEEAVIPYHKIKDKIRAVLKLLTFRDREVLVQFWSPEDVGKHQLLTAVDQPFGLGIVNKNYILYRKESECSPYLVDKDDEEEDWGAPARVYRRGLPEWTSSITNYKDFPLVDLAPDCEFRGYLVLPVFHSTARLCVGVLELLMGTERASYAYEVKQIDRGLKVPSDQKQNRMDKIHSILKEVCLDMQYFPIAQTWAVSPLTSYVAHRKILQKTCSSFDTKCIGKVCMSTSGLPFYIVDPDIMWHFRGACRKRHLEKTRGIVGQALVTHGSCYCEDVTKLSEEEYPLVHNARMSGLTGCFTISLHSFEGDGHDEYVIEFFLKSKYNDRKYIAELVDSLKHQILVNSGFELGDVSSIEAFEPFKGDKNLSLDIEPHIIPISSTTEANTLLETGFSNSEPIVANVAESAVVPSQFPIGYAHGNETSIDAGKKNSLKKGRKRKINSLTLEAVQQHFGMTIGQAADSLGVSRSTLKRFCREHNISSWPMTRHNKNDQQLPYSEIAHGSPKTNRECYGYESVDGDDYL